MIGDTVGLLLRLGLSLAAVVALMWFAARMMRGQLKGGNNGLIDVVARQQLGRGSSLAVVRIADQALVVGVTESKVSLLAQADLAAITAAQEATTAEEPVVRSAVSTTPGAAGAPKISGRSGDAGAPGGLHGSILAPSTWKQAVNVLRDRTARKG
jgi:flagellar protein FliO/FliZ